VKVLVADDDPIMRLFLSRVLAASGYEVVTAANGLEAEKLLQSKNGPKLAIVDWVMPGMDGIELCSRVRSRRDCPYVYLLLVTSKNAQQEVLKGLEAGADDYLTKPVQVAELQARLRIGKRIIDLQQQLIEACEATQFKASHDSLTSLWNRSAILSLLENHFAKAQREDTDVTVLMIDVDHFKDVNDTYGHVQGDIVLCEVARRMRSALRPYDLLGRYGGEEFLVIAPECSLHDGGAVGERIRHAISDTPVDLDGAPLIVTVSVGVATGRKLSLEVESQLLQSADMALYKAKQSGRNCVKMAETSSILTDFSRPRCVPEQRTLKLYNPSEYSDVRVT